MELITILKLVLPLPRGIYLLRCPVQSRQKEVSRSSAAAQRLPGDLFAVSSDGSHATPPPCSLIPSFGAWTRSCFVPRYRSVVCTDAWPRSNWICSKLAAGGPAQLRGGAATIVRRDARDASSRRVRPEHLPDDLFGQHARPAPGRRD